MPKGVYQHKSKPMPEETKRKISNSRKNRLLNLGYLNSPETRIKISQRLKGRKLSEETKNKMKIAVNKRDCGKFWRGKRRPEITGEKSHLWKGGVSSDGNGYRVVYNPHHPFAKKRGYIFEHRLVMEKHLGRYLESQEVVHHINDKRDDNRLENLQLFKNNNEHIKFHNCLKG